MHGRLVRVNAESGRLFIQIFKNGAYYTYYNKSSFYIEIRDGRCCFAVVFGINAVFLSILRTAIAGNLGYDMPYKVVPSDEPVPVGFHFLALIRSFQW